MPTLQLVGSLNTYVFNARVTEPHRLLLVEENIATPVKKMQLQQSRNIATKSGASLGKQKSVAKFTVTTTAPNADDMQSSHDDDIILNIEGSVPVGCSNLPTFSDVQVLRDVAIAYVNSDAFIDLFFAGQLANAPA